VPSSAAPSQNDGGLEGVERAAIDIAIRTHRGNLTRVAKELRIAKSTLYFKMHKYALEERVSEVRFARRISWPAAGEVATAHPLARVEGGLRMRTRFGTWSVWLAVIVVCGVLMATVQPVVGQVPSGYTAPRSKNGDGKPDLNGIWQVLNTANWDILSHSQQPGPVYQLGAMFFVPTADFLDDPPPMPEPALVASATPVPRSSTGSLSIGSLKGQPQ